MRVLTHLRFIRVKVVLVLRGDDRFIRLLLGQGGGEHRGPLQRKKEPACGFG